MVNWTTSPGATNTASPHDIHEAVRREPLEYPPGTQVVYSDPGFILLGEILQVVTGMPLHEFAQKHVFQPLDLKTTGYLPTR